MKTKARYEELLAEARANGQQISLVLHRRGMAGPVSVDWIPSGTDVPLAIAMRTMELFLSDAPLQDQLGRLEGELRLADIEVRRLSRLLEDAKAEANDLANGRDFLAERAWADCAKAARLELEP